MASPQTAILLGRAALSLGNASRVRALENSAYEALAPDELTGDDHVVYRRPALVAGVKSST